MYSIKLENGYKTKGVYNIKVFSSEDIDKNGLQYCLDNNLQSQNIVEENLTTRYFDDVMNYKFVRGAGSSNFGQLWSLNKDIHTANAGMCILASTSDLVNGFDYYNRYNSYGLTHTFYSATIQPFANSNLFTNCFISYKNLFNAIGGTNIIRTVGLTKPDSCTHTQLAPTSGVTSLVSVLKLSTPITVGPTDKLYIEYTLSFIFDTANKDSYQLYQGLFTGREGSTYIGNSSPQVYMCGKYEIQTTVLNTPRADRRATLGNRYHTQAWYYGSPALRLGPSSSATEPYYGNSVSFFVNPTSVMVSEVSANGYYQRPYATYNTGYELYDGNKIYLVTDRFNTNITSRTFYNYASYQYIFKNESNPTISPVYKHKSGISTWHTDFTNPPTQRANSSITAPGSIGIPYGNQIFKLVVDTTGDIAPLSYGVVTFNADNTITTTSNWKLTSGYSIIFRFSSSEALPSGITSNTDYYAKPISDNSQILRLSTTQSNSDSNVFITFSQGNVAHTYYFTKTNTANVNIIVNNTSTNDRLHLAGIKEGPRGAIDPFFIHNNFNTALELQYQHAFHHKVRWTCIDTVTKNIYLGLNTADNFTNVSANAKNIECSIYSKGLASIEDLEYEGQHNSTTCAAVLQNILYTGDMSGKIKKWNINPTNGRLTYNSEIDTGVNEIILSLEKDPHRNVIWALVRNNGLIKITDSTITYHFRTTSGSPLNGAPSVLFNQTVGSLLVSEGKVKWGCRTASISLDTNNLKNTLSQSVYVGKDTASFQNGGIFFDDLQVYNTITTNAGLVSGGACIVNIEQTIGVNKLVLVKYKPSSNETGNQASLSFYTKDQGGTGHNIVRVYNYTNNANGSELGLTLVKELTKGIPDVTVTETNSRNYGTDVTSELGVRALIMLSDVKLLGDILMFKRFLWHDAWLSTVVSSVSVTTEYNYTYRPYTEIVGHNSGAWSTGMNSDISSLQSIGFNGANGVACSQPYAIFLGYQDHTNTTLTYYAWGQQSKNYDNFMSNDLEFMQLIGLCDRFLYDPTINEFWDTGIFGLNVATRLTYSGPAKESYTLDTLSPGVQLTWSFANDYAYSPSSQLIAGEAQTFRFNKFPWKNINQTASMRLIFPYYEMTEKTLTITSTASYTVPEKTSDPLFKALALVTVKEGSIIYREVETIGAVVPGAFFKTPSTGVITFHASDVGKSLNLIYSYTVNRF